MIRKYALLAVIASMFIFAGCETAKGMAKDIENTHQGVLNADDWIRDNLW